MLKKLVLTAVVAGAAAVALRGTHLGHYFRSEAVSLREWADDQVPVEKKIAQMRKDVAGLDRDVDRVKDELAKEIVEVRELTADVSKTKDQLAGETQRLVERGARIKSDGEKVSAGGGSVVEAKDRLKRDRDIVLRKQEQLKSLEQTLGHRERIRETLEKQLDSMLTQKHQLKSEIDAVAAEFKAIQFAQVESRYAHDDSRLSKVKEDLRAMRKKLSTERVKLELAPRGVEETSPAPAAANESVDDILAPVSGKPAKIGKSE